MARTYRNETGYDSTVVNGPGGSMTSYGSDLPDHWMDGPFEWPIDADADVGALITAGLWALPQPRRDKNNKPVVLILQENESRYAHSIGRRDTAYFYGEEESIDREGDAIISDRWFERLVWLK